MRHEKQKVDSMICFDGLNQSEDYEEIRGTLMEGVQNERSQKISKKCVGIFLCLE